MSFSLFFLRKGKIDSIALFGKESSIYISDRGISQLLSRHVSLCCNYMVCFARRCTVVNFFLLSEGSPAWMLECFV